MVVLVVVVKTMVAVVVFVRARVRARSRARVRGGCGGEVAVWSVWCGGLCMCVSEGRLDGVGWGGRGGGGGEPNGAGSAHRVCVTQLTMNEIKTWQCRRINTFCQLFHQ